jgi:hypothetical protein
MKKVTVVFEVPDDVVIDVTRDDICDWIYDYELVYGDGIEAMKALKELLPFVERFFPDCTTPTSRAAIKKARKALEDK